MPKILDDDFDEAEMFSAPVIAPPVKAKKTTGNPLAAYFRMPGLSIGLPTGGRFLPPGAIQLDAQGKVEVYPMRSADELLLKAPDALMSGLAIEKLIESCVPAIRTPSLVSAPDLDVLLLAIRAASYGNMMPVEVDCPQCSAELAFDCDLSTVLATMEPVPETLDVRLSDDVVVVMIPHTLASQTRLLLAAYEEQRRAQAMDSNDLDDAVKQQILRETLTRLGDFQNNSLVDSIVKIAIPDQEVTDRANIKEFVTKTNKDWSDKMQKRMDEINMMGLNRDIPAHCDKCGHEWVTKLEFNPATFFGQGS